MSLQVYGKSITSISIIDDDPQVRSSYMLPLEDLDVVPIPEDGPLTDLSTFIQNTKSKAQAALCDLHLRVRSYSPYNGAELVAEWYKEEFPALLCTRYVESIHEIRPYRQFIPVLLDHHELDPETIEKGIHQCIGEFNDNFLSSRKPWRTLVRIEDLEVSSDQAANATIHVAIPSWDLDTIIPINGADVPGEVLGKIKEGESRFHVKVNIGAERHEDIYFDFVSWET